MTRPILYSFRRCPYAMRARMALWISGVTVELREVILKNKPAEMIAASPKATVPVLDLGSDGGVIDESLNIMEWALARNDPDGWLGATPDDLEAMKALVAENDGPFKHHLDRYKYASRYEDADALAHRHAGSAFLEALETRLAQNGQLFGPAPMLADIAIFPFVRQFRIADPDWFDVAPFARVRSWLDGHVASPVFTAVMKKYAPWQSGEAGIGFGQRP